MLLKYTAKLDEPYKSKILQLTTFYPFYLAVASWGLRLARRHLAAGPSSPSIKHLSLAKNIKSLHYITLHYITLHYITIFDWEVKKLHFNGKWFFLDLEREQNEIQRFWNSLSLEWVNLAKQERIANSNRQRLCWNIVYNVLIILF